MEWSIILIVIVVIGGIVFGISEAEKLAKEKEAYEESLEELKHDPTNANLRQETLRLGRVYSNSTRNNKGVTIFDEVALMNDINAACAGASVVAAQSQINPAEQIQSLLNLMNSGVITQQEFQRAKANIIGKPPSQVEEATKLLRNLHELYKGGALSESEYNLKKWDILSHRLIPRDDMPPRPD